MKNRILLSVISAIILSSILISSSFSSSSIIVMGTPSRLPDSNNWYNHPLTITWNGTESQNGTITCQLPTTFSGPDGNLIKITGHCIDNLGNTGNGNFTLQYDSTLPNISGDTTTQANSYGWFNNNVTVHFTASDSLSGIATVCCDTRIGSEAANQSAT